MVETYIRIIDKKTGGELHSHDVDILLKNIEYKDSDTEEGIILTNVKATVYGEDNIKLEVLPDVLHFISANDIETFSIIG